MKKITAAIVAAAVFLAACSPVEEDVPDQTDAVPADASVSESVSQTETSAEKITVNTVDDSLVSRAVTPVSENDTQTVTENETDIKEVSEAVYQTEEAAETITETQTEYASVTETQSPVTEETAAAEASGDTDTVTSITLTFYSVTLSVGESCMPIVSISPETAPDKSEIWTSSDETVAQVDGLGNINAVSEGSCTVTVRAAADPDVYAQVEVTVNPRPQLTYIDGILIANKTYALPADYNPGVNSEAKSAFDKMQAAAADEGLNIYISSGFRSYDYQAGLYERYVQKSGKAEADRYSARPGHSEHQTGLAFDMNTIDMTFADTEEYTWVKAHCAEYGFIIRYPEDGEAITGYMYEPWHVRYLGVETAKKVTDSGLTLEEYLGIDSKYKE